MRKLVTGLAGGGLTAVSAFTSGPLAVLVVASGCAFLVTCIVLMVAVVFFDAPNRRSRALIEVWRRTGAPPSET
jgi:hypothetical protein